MGTITTVSTPAITTYQKGSVVDKEETAVSEHGITYAAGEEPIYITVNTAGTLEELTLSNTKLYKLAAADADATEADLILAPSKLTDKEVTGDDKLSLLSDEVSVQGITFATSTTVKFSPAAGQTYAVEFSKDAVSEAYVAATGTYVSGTTYYTDNTGATTVDTSSFVAGETSVASYYVKRDASAAVKVYKVIKVAAATPEP